VNIAGTSFLNRGHFLPRGAATVGRQADRLQRIYRWAEIATFSPVTSVAARRARRSTRRFNSYRPSKVAALAELAHLAQHAARQMSDFAARATLHVYAWSLDRQTLRSARAADRKTSSPSRRSARATDHYDGYLVITTDQAVTPLCCTYPWYPDAGWPTVRAGVRSSKMPSSDVAFARVLFRPMPAEVAWSFAHLAHISSLPRKFRINVIPKKTCHVIAEQPISH
jgi:hypothetical protein